MEAKNHYETAGFYENRTYKFDIPESDRIKSLSPTNAAVFNASLQMFPDIKKADIKTAGFSVVAENSS